MIRRVHARDREIYREERERKERERERKKVGFSPIGKREEEGVLTKNNSKLTNLVKISRIEGYNGEYGSNPQGNRKFSDGLFEFDQIRQ